MDEEWFYNQCLLAKTALNKELHGKFDCAVGNDRTEGTKYQIMTDSDIDFFDWYCYYYENAQWYETPFEAAFFYLAKRIEWVNVGSPKLFGGH